MSVRSRRRAGAGGLPAGPYLLGKAEAADLLALVALSSAEERWRLSVSPGEAPCPRPALCRHVEAARRKPPLGVLASQSDRLISRSERCRPGDRDGVLHALMRGTALRVKRQRPLGRLSGLGGHGEVIMHVDG